MTLHPRDVTRLMALEPHGMHCALLPSDRADEPATLLWTATTAADVYAEIQRRRGTAVADRCVIRPIGDVLREVGR